jgi:putative chitinase
MPTFNSEVFFDAVRQHPFNGKLSQGQVDGMNFILRGFRKKYIPTTNILVVAGNVVFAISDIHRRWLAYCLATTFHETAYTMTPVTEYGSQSYLQGKDYYPYIGRGYVQLTWEENYEKCQNAYGEPFLTDPDLALQPDLAAEIMFDGMEHGIFTGVGLPDYFNDTTNDPVGARKIINGTDKDDEIAAYHYDFLDALNLALAA